MCGIAGIVNFGGEPVDTRVLTAMTDILAHRGPDGWGTWIDGNVGLGHRRLAIRDLSEQANQPMHDAADTTVVTYNGEIYNDVALRSELAAIQPLRFLTTSDTEVIAPAYTAWDTGAFARFEGMFAIGLWDRRRQRMILVRDPIGIKPLYYSWNGSSLRFASEIKGLLAAPETSRQISVESLHRYLAQGYPGPERTLLRDVQPVPPGSILVADAQGIRVSRYWRPTRTGEIRDMPTALAAFDSVWNAVMSDILVSDVPVGLLLSGGIDSGLAASTLSGKSVPAFTARFATHEYDEGAQATAIASKFGLEHVSVDVEDASELEQRFIKMVYHYDGNCADSSGLAFSAVCKAARRRMPVVLTGDGADEFFGGYETYRASRIAALASPLIPKRLSALGAQQLRRLCRHGHGRIPASEKMARLFSGMAFARGMHHPQWRRYLFPEQMETVYAGPLLALGQLADPLDEYAATMGQSGTLVDRCLLGDQTYYLPGDLLVKSDAMSMAHGVEVRVPFLDRRMMELAGKLDSSLLTPLRGPDKKILRAALARRGVPPAISRAEKRGFKVPVDAHLRGALRPLAERMLVRDGDALAPYLSPNGVARLWREHVELRADHGYALWTLLTFAVWRDATGVR
ncbi:MAG TPA: asparagine synthase (glutamine-hydrolyzing) [Burkholderiaceae bacterium]|nr:asparagine synthase (glutamine-hydrolyzing) [Burkholderiaceae bacterium]